MICIHKEKFNRFHIRLKYDNFKTVVARGITKSGYLPYLCIYIIMCNFLLYFNTIKRSRHFIYTSHMVASISSIKKIELPSLINDILYFVKFFESVLFSFVSREGKSLAHLLAQ